MQAVLEEEANMSAPVPEGNEGAVEYAGHAAEAVARSHSVGFPLSAGLFSHGGVAGMTRPFSISSAQVLCPRSFVAASAGGASVDADGRDAARASHNRAVLGT